MRYLCAYSHLYSKAKTLMGLQAFLIVPIPLAWSAVVISNPEVKPYMVLYSLAIALLDAVLLNRAQARMKEEAARIQEMFDCLLFEIPWRELQVGMRVDLESLIEYESKYRKKHVDLGHLRNWFHSDVGSIPLEYARLVCQRTNLLWDTRLRKTYATALEVTLWIFVVAVIALSVRQSMPMDLFLSTVVIVALPAIVWGVREVSAHNDTLLKLGKLKNYLDRIWNEVLNQSINSRALEAITGEIQSEIYHLRAKNPVIFNWVYKLQRKKAQMRVDSVTRDLISELKSKGSWSKHQ